MPARNATTSAGEHDEIGARRLAEAQPDHEIEEERRQQQPRADQRHFGRRRERGHDHRADAERRRDDADADLVPAVVEPLRGAHQHQDDGRHVHAEAHEIGDARVFGGQHEVIEDREPDDRARRQQDGEAVPRHAGARGARHGIHFRGVRGNAGNGSRSRAVAPHPSCLATNFVGAMRPDPGDLLDERCFVCVRPARRKLPRAPGVRRGTDSAGRGSDWRSSRACARLRTDSRPVCAPALQHRANSRGEMPSSFAALSIANSSRSCSV